MQMRKSDSLSQRFALSWTLRHILGSFALIFGTVFLFAANGYGQIALSAYPFVNFGGETVRLGGTLGIGWKTMKAEFWMNMEFVTYKEEVRHDDYWNDYPSTEGSVIEGSIVGLYHQPIRIGKQPVKNVIPFFEVGGGLGSILRDEEDEKFQAMVLAAVGLDIANKFRIRFSPFLKTAVEKPFGFQISAFILLGLNQSITEEVEN